MPVYKRFALLISILGVLVAGMVLAACSPVGIPSNPASAASEAAPNTLPARTQAAQNPTAAANPTQPENLAQPDQAPFQVAKDCSKVRISNPAASYCLLMDYRIESIQNDSGQSSACVFPDNSSCDVWEFYAGTCGGEFSYCAKSGLDVKTSTDGKDSYSPNYAVCQDGSGKVVGSVTKLMGLQDLLNSCQ